VARREVVIDYAPREAFKAFHQRKQRWACLVAHRRAGKTVSAINDLIRAAVMCKSRNPLFGYIAPYRSQAKSVAWGYLKQYAAPISQQANEQELEITLVNGAKIRLFGADNADAMRGLGFDGVLLDEFGDFKPSVWGSIIRPALSDKQGWAVFMGTPKGKNQFWDVYQTSRMNPEEWFSLRLKASDSGILPQSEIEAVKAQISEDQFMQEYETNFEAAIIGAFYGVEMRMAADDGRITEVKYDPSLSTYTAWDLGYRDDTAIWWYQVVKGEIHIIDYHSVSGASIPEIAKVVLKKPYHYLKHYLPHDARAKTLAAQGKSIIEQLGEFLGLSNLAIVPDLSVQDGIQAVRMTLPRCYFDEEKCLEGIEALRQYQREWDEDKKSFRSSPKHDWTSHGSDAMRMLAIAWRDEPSKRMNASERPLMVGPGNTATLNDMWAGQRKTRRTRI
jgi:phage terminase large subunit